MFLSLTLVNPDENLNQKMEFPYTEETKLKELKEQIQDKWKIGVAVQKMFAEDGRQIMCPDLEGPLASTELKDLENIIVKHGKMDTWITLIRATDDLKQSCVGNFNAEELQNILYPLCEAFLEDLDKSGFFITYPNVVGQRVELQRTLASCFAKICKALEKAAKTKK